MKRTWTPAQETAMNLCDRTLLVSAAAGSGKTSVLTERIIRRLTDEEKPADLSRMLIVTYTRAAAAELKSRISAALSDAFAAHPENTALAQQILHVGSADICTIDSFFQKIVREHFTELQLPAAFRIADESEVLPISLSVLKTLTEEFYRKYESKNAEGSLFALLSDNAFADTVEQMMSDRSDGKAESRLLSLYEKITAYPEGGKALYACADDLRREGDPLNTMLGKQCRKYLSGCYREFLATLEDHREQIRLDSDSWKKVSGVLSADIDFCRALTETLETGTYSEVRQTALGYLPASFPRGMSEKTPDIVAYQTFRTFFTKHLKETLKPMLEDPEEELRRQLARTADICEVLGNFYTEYEARVREEKNARGILEFKDIRANVLHLLQNPDGTPTPAACALTDRYDEVYIDEYQDVDDLQDLIFSVIGKEHRFMVGDIKQCIYQFRGSKPAIFARYRKAFPLYDETDPDASRNGACVFMSENFRCAKPIVDFSNAVCAFLFSACEENVGYRPEDDLRFSKTVPEGVPSNPVECAVFEPRRKTDPDAEDTPSDEPVWVADRIEELLRDGRLDNGNPIRPSDIAILVRVGKHAIPFVEELNRRGIPTAGKAENVWYKPMMTDLINLLTAIDNPYRDIPLSECLLSPFGGFTPDEIRVIRDAAPQEKALFDAMEAIDRSTPLGQKADAFLAFLARQRDHAVMQPADRFLRLLYLDERMRPFADDPTLLFLYEKARTYQRSSFCGLYGFLGAITEMREKNAETNVFETADSAVTVLTIHHSKGLEFPVVFLVNCGKTFNKEDLKEPVLFQHDCGLGIRFFDRETGTQTDSLAGIVLKKAIAAEQTEEEIRVLYVALTRARERLFVTGSITGKQTFDSFNKATELPKRGQRTAILSISSFLGWIVTAIRNDTGRNRADTYRLNYFASGTIPAPVREAEACSTEPAAPAQTAIADPVTERFARIARDANAFSYPLDALRGLPTKAAASKLKPDLLDLLGGDEEKALESKLELMQAAPTGFDLLLKAKQTPSATDIGSANHAFLEFCDFAKLAKNGVDEESARLEREGFLSAESAALLNRAQLGALAHSNLAAWIADAKMVRREQQFNFLVPLGELTTDRTYAKKLDGHSLFVQGSIDLLLEMRDGRLILVDYKTDRLLPGKHENREEFRKRMRDAHGDQLSYYARAVRQLFGKTPDEIYIYSLPLGEAVGITL